MDIKKYQVNPDKFRAARMKKGYTVQDLAQKYNYSKSLIEKYEKGGAYISEENLEAISKLLDIEPTDIIVESLVETDNFEQSIDYLRWKFLVDSIAGNFGVGGTYLHFRDCVEKYCAPYWEQLSQKKIQVSKEEQKNIFSGVKIALPDNKVYICTRKNRFKKKDLAYLTEIVKAFFPYRTQPEHAIALVYNDRHVFDFFVLQIPKMKGIVYALKEEATEKTKTATPCDIDIIKLDQLLEQLDFADREGKSIDRAQKKRVTDGFFSPDEFIYGADEAAYWEDIVSDTDYRLAENKLSSDDIKKVVSDMIQQFQAQAEEQEKSGW